MAYLIELLESLSPSIVSTFVINAITIIIVFFRTKKKPGNITAEDDLQALINYHETAAKKLRDTLPKNGGT